MSGLDFTKLRAGKPECPSDFALDRLHAGELEGAAKTDATAHVDGCAECAARMTERRAGFAGIPALDERKLLARIRTKVDEPATPGARALAWLRKVLGPVAVLAAAAGAFAVVSRQPVDVERSATTEKGPPILHVYRLVDGRGIETVSGDPFAPGDRIRFVVDLKETGNVAIVGVEAGGGLYNAWPLDPATPTLQTAGHGIELPGAVALDGAPGRETLYLVECPPDVGAPACRPGAGVGARPTCPDTCQLSPFVIEKSR